ncbi:MAG: DUF2147 domain-containing protein [Burkholderiaceae bacterium]
MKQAIYRQTRRLAVAVLAALAFGVAWPALAQGASPEGLWRTIDDETGAAKSLVRISREGDALVGAVEQILTPGKENALCEACEGERHGKPVLGMRILWDVVQQGDEYGGGRILDPANGKTYKVKLWLGDDPNTLTVRGYIGLPLLGRSQTWQRVQ